MKRVALLCLFFLLACRVAVDKPAHLRKGIDDGRQGKGPALAVIGDSLSSGVLASTTMGGDLDRATLNQLGQIMFAGEHGLETMQGQFSELENSAMTTDQDWGMRAAIAARHGLKAKDIPLYYAAKWGGRLANVKEYLDHLAVNYKERGKPAEYVLMILGGNDFCYGRPPADFQSEFEMNFKAVLRLHPQSTIFVALTPNFSDILKHHHEYGPILSCDKFRILYCRRSIFDQDGAEVLAGYNEGIIRVVNSYRHAYAGNIHLISEFEAMTIDATDLCFDCFHLSLAGHKKFGAFFHSIVQRVPLL